MPIAGIFYWVLPLVDCKLQWVQLQNVSSDELKIGWENPGQGSKHITNLTNVQLSFYRSFTTFLLNFDSAALFGRYKLILLVLQKLNRSR